MATKNTAQVRQLDEIVLLQLKKIEHEYIATDQRPSTKSTKHNLLVETANQTNKQKNYNGLSSAKAGQQIILGNEHHTTIN